MKSINTLWGNILKKRPIIEAIRDVHLFKELTPIELRIIEKFLHPRTYQKGEIIFFEGDPGVGMYIVMSGKVSITKNTGSGRKIMLATIEDGGFFGEISVIEGGARTANATAIEETELLGFFKADMAELIKRRPAMASKILFEIAGILGERLRITNEELSRVSAKSGPAVSD